MAAEISQRTISANGAPPLHKGAPASVFDLAPPQLSASVKPKRKPPRPSVKPTEVDLDAVEIELGVPVQTKSFFREAGQSRYAPLLARLTKVGMSFKLPSDHTASVRTAAAAYEKRNGAKLMVRVISSTECRVWRVG